MTETTSTAPNGEQFPLPTQQDEAAELRRLQALVADHRAQGHEIVVVLGVGFVGAVMAGIVADSVDKTTGKPGKFVIGVQRPSTRSYWKIPLLNKGVAPVEAEVSMGMQSKYKFCTKQIAEYVERARRRKLNWADETGTRN